MKKRRKKLYLATWLAVLSLGILIGSSISLLKTGDELDRLYSKNKQLLGTIKDKEEQIIILEERLATKKENVIEKIQLHIILPEETWANHSAIKETLEQDIKKILNPVMGQPINETKPAFIQALLNLRIIHTNQGQFQLKIQWIVIYKNLEIQLTAHPIT